MEGTGTGKKGRRSTSSAAKEEVEDFGLEEGEVRSEEVFFQAYTSSDEVE